MNPTGYSQRLASGAFVGSNSAWSVRTFGDDALFEFGAAGMHELFYDGQGNTRQLGTVTSSNRSTIVLAEAYGDELGWDPAITPPQTDLLYAGEQRDQATGMTYLRDRYLDTQTGLFKRLDPFFGSQSDMRASAIIVSRIREEGVM
jgi:RHS repeat-associated protein